MNENITIKPSTLTPFRKFCMTIGELPTSYLESMSYYEMLLWFTKYLSDTVIPAVNNNAEALEELQTLFTELQNYVNDYFENLDVQDEIDNKLDEMVESGELTEIIAQYLQLSSVLGYATKNDLKNAESLIAGNICRIIGDVTYNDGKGAYYYIRTVTTDDVIDNDEIIALNNYNTLIGEKIPDYEIEQINSQLDDIDDDITELDETKVNIANMEWIKDDHEVLPKYGQYYVDGTNGSDTNNGLTQETAFQTLAPIWQKVKEGNMEIRFYLAGGNTYQWTPYIMNDLIFHINHYGTGDITIQMPNDPVAFYNCHVNCQGTSSYNIIWQGATEMYFDGGTTDLRYVDIRHNLGNWGAGGRIRNSIIHDIKAHNSNLWFEACNIGGGYGVCSVINFGQCTFNSNHLYYSSQSSFYAFDNCQISIIGSTYFDMSNGSLSIPFLTMRGGQLSQVSMPNVSGEVASKFTVGVAGSGMMWSCATNRANGFTNVAQTAYNLQGGSYLTGGN